MLKVPATFSLLRSKGSVYAREEIYRQCLEAKANASRLVAEANACRERVALTMARAKAGLENARFNLVRERND